MEKLMQNQLMDEKCACLISQKRAQRVEILRTLVDVKEISHYSMIFISNFSY